MQITFIVGVLFSDEHQNPTRELLRGSWKETAPGTADFKLMKIAPELFSQFSFFFFTRCKSGSKYAKKHLAFCTDSCGGLKKKKKKVDYNMISLLITYCGLRSIIYNFSLNIQGDSDEEEGDYDSQEEDNDDNEDETSVRIDPRPECNKGLHNGTPWSVGWALQIVGRCKHLVIFCNAIIGQTIFVIWEFDCYWNQINAYTNPMSWTQYIYKFVFFTQL